MRSLVAGPQAPQYKGCGGNGGLVQLDKLEAPGQGCVLLKVFFVFLPGRGGTGAYFAAGQGRLHEVGGIGTASRGTASDQKVRFVNEENA